MTGLRGVFAVQAKRRALLHLRLIEAEAKQIYYPTYRQKGYRAGVGALGVPSALTDHVGRRSHLRSFAGDFGGIR